ncbi:MAG: glutamate-5-semialdehyde dehydrogenase [Acholeplasmatales bacterium]|nr:glutamate-5-semialdehyde dehydrogenase [Acholeplasmatales bacterium]
MDELLNKTKLATKSLQKLNEAEINKLLKNIAIALDKNRKLIISENEKDIKEARLNNLKESMIERLTLNDKRIDSLITSINELIELPYLIGETIEEWTSPKGFNIKKIRVPFGVIGAIFESRPNVSVDIATMTLKAGSACVLKGGKEAINSNKVLVQVMQDAIKDMVDPNVITLIPSTDRKVTDELITKKGLIDLLIPRGSKNLIDYVTQNAKIPYIETGAGNCHLYIEASADLDMALNIAVNAKYQRPSVCNAIETILVDDKIKDKFLPILAKKFNELNIEMRGCEKTRSVINCNIATEDDYYKEYNDYICAIKVVDNVDEAIAHISKYSTKHSESIVTNNEEAKNKFFKELDSVCLYHNVSTRFTDGGCFGFGAEIGISTTKLHARGPMGIKEITTYKYIISGNGEVRD